MRRHALPLDTAVAIGGGGIIMKLTAFACRRWLYHCPRNVALALGVIIGIIPRKGGAIFEKEGRHLV